MNERPVASHRVPRFVGMTLVAVAAVIAAAWIALLVVLPHDRVVALVRAQLAASLRREVRLADVSVSLWPPVRLRAKGFELAEPGGFGRGVAVRVPATDLDLDVLPLLSRRLVVRSLTLDRPGLHIVLRKDGTTNLDSLFAAGPGAAAKPEAGAALNLAVRRLAVREGELLLDDLASNRRVFLGFGTRLSLSAEDGVRIATKGRTTLSRLAIGTPAARGPSDLNPSLANLVWVVEHEGRLDARAKALELRRLQLALGRARIGLSGTVGELGPRALVNLRAEGRNVDVGQILGYLAAADVRALRGVRGGGRLAFDLAIQGRLGAASPGCAGCPPAVTGTLSVGDGSFQYPGAPAGVSALAFTARFQPDQVQIGDLRARVADQALRAQVGVRRFADPLVRFAMEGGVDLAALSQLLAPRDTRIGGRLDLSVHGAGRVRDPGSIALDGRATLANASLEGPALPRRVEAISAAIQLEPERATVRGFSARAGQSSFELDAAVTRPLALMREIGKVEPAGVTFTFRSPYLDLAELLPPGPGGPVAVNARGGGRVEIAKFRNQRLEVENLVANVALEPGVIQVPSFALRAYGGAVTGDARFGFEDPAKPSFAVKGRADTVRVEQFLAAVSPARGVLAGVTSTNFDVSGAGTQPEQLRSTLTALGLALLAEGRLSGPVMDAVALAARTPSLREVRFKELRLPFRVDRGRVVTDSVRFGGGSGEWLVSGLVGFDGSLDYAVSATLPPDVAGRSGLQNALAAGLLSDGQGRLLLDLRVTGSAKSPRVALDVPAMRARLAGRASSVIREQRQRLGETLVRAAGLAPRDSAAGLAPRDSAAVRAPADGKALGRELQKEGRDLLRGLLGRKPAVTDTTKK